VPGEAAARAASPMVLVMVSVVLTLTTRILIG
jgi:hypothetical protein